jgi:hypothetical protein
MRNFKGRSVARRSQPVFLSTAATPRHHYELFGPQRLAVVDERNLFMRPLKAIATLASVAAIAGSMFAASWVGLALLGF